MFGIGMQELVLILVIALIILGPKKLPDVAKALGKALNEFKRATSDIKESLDLDHSLNTVKKSFDAMNNTPPAAATPASDPGPSDIKPPAPSPEEAAPKTPQPPHASS
ncbi:MAG: Sec-independent protein translocase protein TatB [Pseudomonadota bacterium]